jgi:hypothetical protein
MWSDGWAVEGREGRLIRNVAALENNCYVPRTPSPVFKIVVLEGENVNSS